MRAWKPMIIARTTGRSPLSTPSMEPKETEPCYEFGVAGKRDHVQTYEIHCGGRVVSSVRSYTARHAVTDYLRSPVALMTRWSRSQVIRSRGAAPSTPA